MRGNNTAKEYSNQLGRFFKGNRSLLLMAFILIIGMITGTLLIKNSNVFANSYVSTLFSDFISARRGQPFINTLFISFFSMVPFLIALYVSGLCAVGMPACIFVPLFRGLGLGLTAGYLYASLSLKGIAFYALIIIPGAFISSIVLILAGKEALKFSANMFRTLIPDAKSNRLPDEFKNYSFRFLFLMLILFLSSMMDALMSAAFFSYFSF